MGMFDSLFDAEGREWQTKAFNCGLDEYRIGDEIPSDTSAPYQVQVGSTFGRWPDYDFRDSFATIRDGRLERVPDDRDKRLPLLNYSGHLIETPHKTKGI